ncbi:lytic transglycosylase [Streptomyces triticagri]|uniref:Lytic transglycosylase n=1 Tax=Streptomyces triticagri TaxID=2293568 RepID=A0A372M2X8_9ACTN|nr:lytic transglycosylase domain-containing protein [Streptomyces triticagri]RFU85276.1 lytic transglycosylase [Streptomyces triticagri]
MAAVFGRRLRKTTVTAAVAAAAVAALSASQAPGLTDTPQGRKSTSDSSRPSGDDSATGDSPYYTDLPPLKSPKPPGDGGKASPGEAEAGIPATVLDAYKKAESALREARPGCNLPWQLLAAIGKVESGQARGGKVDRDGTTLSPILGPQLNGDGFAKITDTDGGAYDGDTTHDRAVGPMQFIPQTWSNWGKDGNKDGKKDPNNIYDAALAAGHYLCGDGRDLASTADLHRAILSYNRSQEYLNTVLTWLEYYRKGTHEVPDGTGVQPDDRSDAKRPGAAGPSPSPSPGKGSGGPSPSPGGSGKPGGGGGSGKPGGGGGGSETPGGGGGGGGSESPSPGPADRVAALEAASTGELTATEGTTFATRPSVTAHDAKGAGVTNVKVKFTLVGDTDTRFDGGATSATVTTVAGGRAIAPALEAGEQTGEFTIRAKVVGRTLAGVDQTAKVTARQADALARTSDKALTCKPGGEFADAVEVKATLDGKAAAGVEVSATMIKGADDAEVNDKGPYFKDAEGKTLRTLKGLETDVNGVLKLPKIYADDTAGTHLLRLTAIGGGTITVELEIA